MRIFFPKSNMVKVLYTAIFAIIGIILFQAQDFQNPFDDDNPNIDRPTREGLTHWDAFQHNGEFDVITDALGFDNYDIGIDYAETNVVMHPTNPLWIFHSANGSPQNAWFTLNGGINWTLSQPSYPGGTCCDPWSTYLSNGTLIYGSGVSGQYVYRSTNNGQSWTSPVLSVSGNDRNTIASEQTGTGPYANYVYAAITPGNFARSTDLGASWTTTFSYSNTIPGVMIASGPFGSTNGGCVIYVTNSGSSNNVTYTFHRSTNGGASFTSAVSSLTVAGYSGSYNSAGRLHINNARHRPYPMIAMDNSNGPYRGRLYLAYSSNTPAGNGFKPDIKLQYSTDQGSTWSSQIVVNDDANTTTVDNWFPAIWCDNTTGKLYLKWYDDRENPGSYTTGVWASYSTTGGTTWAPNQRISNASWTYPCPACSPNTNCYRGDYDAFTSNSKVGFATWWDPRNCTYQSMGAYFPDFAMRIRPTTVNMNGINDSQFVFVSVPAVKLYSDTALFTATVLNPPGTGTITLTLLNKTSNTVQDRLTSFPDSLRLRVKTSGGVPTATYNIKLVGKGPNGTPVHERNLQVGVITGISQYNNEIPENFQLYQNYPNPFNPTTNIRFDIAKAGNVKLIVYDITGKVVSELINGQYGAGKFEADFDASNLSTGIYFYKLEAPGFIQVKKMMLVK